MNIEYSSGIGLPFRKKTIDEGVMLEELYKNDKNAGTYPVTAAMVNHEVQPLTYELLESGRIQLLDIRNKQAFLIFQNSFTLVFTKVAQDILGPVHVEVMTSINGGLFIELRNRERIHECIEITDDEAAKMYFAMKELIAKDHPITVRRVSKKDALEMMQRISLDEKSRIFRGLKDDETVRIYTLDDYSDFFYNYLVPSTGYLGNFELIKYRSGILLRFPNQETPDRIPDFVDEYRIYNALMEQHRWNQLLEIDYLADLNEKVVSGDYRTMIKLSEALHDKKIVEIADAITEKQKRVILILGPSSSGKTTFARRLEIQLMVNGLKPLYMGTDDYFVEREATPLDENGEKNYEDIEALELDLFNKHIKALLAGEEVDLPTFNFISGCKEYGKRITSIEPDQPIIIEGIHAFNPLLTEALSEDDKFRIYISPLTQINLDSHNRIPTTDTRMIRRMVRDSRHRGHSAAMTLALWDKVRAGENKNIFPYSSQADVFFNTVHIYEMAVLKKYAVPLLKEVTPDQEEYAEAKRLLRLFRYVEDLKDESVIAGDSILREFIGGSIYA